ncbi:MAG TPA: antibiotic biosynthesis monooxygenase family protein, partial [Chloroflexota bacterium]|nr:antibiotic biosynthesis monooxygenase family protein [Chloroflexota bacterium]
SGVRWRHDPSLPEGAWSMSETEPYTLARWYVKPGHEEAFLAAWQTLGAVFSTLPGVRHGTLVQSVEDPLLFYSFGPWRSVEDIQAMRADPRAQAAFARLGEICTEMQPGVFRRVLHIDATRP